MLLTAFDELMNYAAKLIEPAYSILNDKGVNRIFISPHAYLHSIPIGAIKIAETKEYFIENYEVSYITSLEHLFTSYKNKYRMKDLFSGTIINLFCSPKGRNFIKYGEKEIDLLKSIYSDASIYTLKNKEATKNNLIDSINQMSNPVSQLIFSCHCHCSTLSPSYSYLYLSDGTDAPGPYLCDGAEVQIDDLFQTVSNIEIGLVILSACDTGISFEAMKGIEESTGIDSAFIHSAIPCIVSTTYSVDDRCSFEIMRMFHIEISSGNPPSLALKNAQVNMLKTNTEKPIGDSTRGRMTDKYSWKIDYNHPYYWAFFKYSGPFDYT